MSRAEQGVSGDRYLLVPRVLIFVTRQNSVLLLKGAPDKRLWANRYNGIGGHVERGEDVLSAAYRELEEETGLRVGLRLVGTVIVDVEETIGVGLYVFAGECDQGEPRPSREGTLEWVPFSGLATRPLVQNVEALLERVRRQRPGDPPFSARSFYDENGCLHLVFAEENLQGADAQTGVTGAANLSDAAQ